jgi:hypothetical protein
MRLVRLLIRLKNQPDIRLACAINASIFAKQCWNSFVISFQSSTRLRGDAAGNVENECRFAGHRLNARGPVAAAGHAHEQGRTASGLKLLDAQTLQRRAWGPRIAGGSFDRFEHGSDPAAGFDERNDVSIPIGQAHELDAEDQAVATGGIE